MIPKIEMQASKQAIVVLHQKQDPKMSVSSSLVFEFAAPLLELLSPDNLIAACWLALSMALSKRTWYFWHFLAEEISPHFCRVSA